MAILEYGSQVIEAESIAAVGAPDWPDDQAAATLAAWMEDRVDLGP